MIEDDNWRERGMLALDQGRIAQAVESFQEALAESPDDVRTRVALATAYLRQRDPQTAELHLRRAIQLQPSSATAHALLGSTLLFQFRIDDAREELDTALRLDPADFTVRLERARFFYRLGFFQECTRELENATQLQAPDGAALYYVRQLLNDARARSRRGFARTPLPFGFAG
ncbi:MAG: tetratricopeptide repeat protein [Chloroflexi bacterium]|nr:tetratricopeptide repeat protein [Chloroflexota bacterium]